jgi:hypothetical protein
MKRLTYCLYPELRALPEAERQAALDRAKEMPFDVVELLGMAAGLVAVTAMTRYGVGGFEASGRFILAMVNFLVAIPLLVAAVGPFVLRRSRRGLRDEIGRRSRASGL